MLWTPIKEKGNTKNQWAGNEIFLFAPKKEKSIINKPVKIKGGVEKRF